MTDIQFTYEYTEDVERLLNRLQVALDPGNLGDFLDDEVVPYIQQRGRQRFANEGDDVSGRWKQLTTATQNIRATSGYPAAHPINKRTGDLEEYITGSEATSIRGGGGASIIYPGRGEADGIMQKKMETAQRGRSKPRTPPRPVLGVNEADLRFVMSKLQNNIERALS